MTAGGVSDPSASRATLPAPVARRAVARLIDFTLGGVAFVGLTFVVALNAGRPADGTGVMLVAIGVTFLVVFVYEVVLVAVWGRTLGKQLMGLVIVRAVDGGRPGLVRALLRNLLPTVLLIGFFPLYPLPYLVAAVFGDHRWPHDRLAGTRVVARVR